MEKWKKARVGSAPVTLKIKNFAHLADVTLTFGDLTVLVGPQGAGKSLALQWLKIALDGREVIDALRAAGDRVDHPDVLVDLIFGSGMQTAWRPKSTMIQYGASRITLKNISRRGSGEPELFFIPAQRSLLISDGWALPFQRLKSDTPAVARLFSQSLYDRFNSEDAGTLFPVDRGLKKAIRDKINDAVFHGGQIRIEDEVYRRNLRLVHGKMNLLFMTWTAGQREFTPLLLGLYHLLPPRSHSKHEKISWVVIEEPDMGLHPQAITATLLLIFELINRNYRVVMSTHSPQILTFLWAMKHFQANNAKPSSICQAFGADPPP